MKLQFHYLLHISVNNHHNNRSGCNVSDEAHAFKDFSKHDNDEITQTTMIDVKLLYQGSRFSQS